MVFPHGGAVAIWRALNGPNDDGLPEDAAYNPKKDQIRAWGLAVEAVIENIVQSPSELLEETGLNFDEGDKIQSVSPSCVWLVAADDAKDHHVENAAGKKFYVLPGENGYNVKAFGAKGDGSTDDSAAIKAAFTATVKNQITSVMNPSNPASPNSIYFPGGEYIINSARSLMDAVSGVTRRMGVTYRGDGAATTIHFAYDGDDYLCYNPNTFLLTRFENLFFTCDSDTSKFMFVNASGGAQEVL
ncbi:glycosyl hydrolase family 28-related protein, partial [Primorskyibacter sp. 2E107]|uniref:glycosyl hydrolase family 28-related protein n=1 Tax=Primorskyibacter sp. 2E107 TaxID=3403458 RepID=UPI003AF6E02B